MGVDQADGSGVGVNSQTSHNKMYTSKNEVFGKSTQTHADICSVMVTYFLCLQATSRAKCISHLTSGGNTVFT